MLGRSHIHRLSRFVVAWFVLAIGAAVASPTVSPQHMAILCTANGVSLVKFTAGDVASDQDSSNVGGSATMDCPLCWMPMAVTTAQLQLPAPQLDGGLVARATWVQVRLSPRYTLPARAPPTL
ncbi:hypothetical protein LN050_06375 [Comamonadaceae bacterium M7527]|nr:hypothetical protein LN050_06375 [Comamonadaceae bacterium M7527]